MCKESSEEYAQALDQLEELWFPRQAVVKPKRPEGGDYPNAPLPIYTSYPGKDFVKEGGETYEIDSTCGGWYNFYRLHASIGYLYPVQYEMKFHQSLH